MLWYGFLAFYAFTECVCVGFFLRFIFLIMFNLAFKFVCLSLMQGKRAYVVLLWIFDDSHHLLQYICCAVVFELWCRRISLIKQHQHQRTAGKRERNSEQERERVWLLLWVFLVFHSFCNSYLFDACAYFWSFNVYAKRNAIQKKTSLMATKWEKDFSRN